MSITVYGHEENFIEEIPFGKHGYKKVLSHGSLLLIITSEASVFRVGTKVLLKKNPGLKRSTNFGSGLGSIPDRSTGYVVGFDIFTRTPRVLRIVFSLPEGKKTKPLSISPEEVELLSY